MDQWSSALCAFREACRLEPEQSEYFSRLGITYYQMQQPAAAIQCYTAAFEKSRNPENLFKRSMALLMTGRYQQGWQEYEWRLRFSVISDKFKWHPADRLWQGQPFPGQTIVVYTEQGRGDDIQFCRYLPYVKALGGKVVFGTDPSLVPVLSTLDGVDQIVPHRQDTYASIKMHWAIPLMSLPFLFNTTLDSIPNQTPYLSIPTAYQVKWKHLLAPYLSRPGIKNIGLVYACNPDNYGTVRTCPLTLWQDLFSLPNIQWFSIQKGDAAADIQKYPACNSTLIDLTRHIEDFGDTAALLERLDLLISVDTSVPHLAGALGKPTWLLLPFVVDWRWLLYRADSPWYPGFRLFRQPFPGQWEPVLAKVRRTLSTLS